MTDSERMWVLSKRRDNIAKAFREFMEYAELMPACSKELLDKLDVHQVWHGIHQFGALFEKEKTGAD